MPETVVKADLRTEVLKLKELQETHDRMKATLEEARRKYADEWAETINGVTQLSSDLNAQKEVVAVLAKKEFSVTGEKKLVGGIGIREKAVVRYDEKAAEDFAHSKGLFLAFDKKSFEKAAPTLGLDFVQVIKVPQVTFPKQFDL